VLDVVHEAYAVFRQKSACRKSGLCWARRHHGACRGPHRQRHHGECDHPRELGLKKGDTTTVVLKSNPGQPGVERSSAARAHFSWTELLVARRFAVSSMHRWTRLDESHGFRASRRLFQTCASLNFLLTCFKSATRPW
jgi:hypothetical protein